MTGQGTGPAGAYRPDQPRLSRRDDRGFRHRGQSRYPDRCRPSLGSRLHRQLSRQGGPDRVLPAPFPVADHHRGSRWSARCNACAGQRSAQDRAGSAAGQNTQTVAPGIRVSEQSEATFQCALRVVGRAAERTGGDMRPGPRGFAQLRRFWRLHAGYGNIWSGRCGLRD